MKKLGFLILATGLLLAGCGNSGSNAADSGQASNESSASGAASGNVEIFGCWINCTTTISSSCTRKFHL